MKKGGRPEWIEKREEELRRLAERGFFEEVEKGIYRVDPRIKDLLEVV